MAVYSLDQIIDMITAWEKDLQKFYKKIKSRLAEEEAVQAVTLLSSDQEKMIKFLDQVSQNHHEKLEYHKNLPEYKNIVHGIDLNGPVTAKTFFEKIFDYEEELLKIYQNLRDIVTFDRSKEVLDMALQMKMGQIKKIKGCMDSFV
ncbi:MAG: hypothetical protein AB7S78_09720 [Candidatus Omnitrophota bacterium]